MHLLSWCKGTSDVNIEWIKIISWIPCIPSYTFSKGIGWEDLRSHPLDHDFQFEKQKRGEERRECKKWKKIFWDSPLDLLLALVHSKLSTSPSIFPPFEWALRWRFNSFSAREPFPSCLIIPFPDLVGCIYTGFYHHNSNTNNIVERCETLPYPGGSQLPEKFGMFVFCLVAGVCFVIVVIGSHSF